MSDKEGCSHRYPGIGNIAYVKDLMTRKIATRNFMCSRFGADISTGLGWVGSYHFLLCSFGFVVIFVLDNSSGPNLLFPDSINENKTIFI